MTNNNYSSLEKGIAVLKKYPGHKRSLNLNVCDPSCPEAAALSELELDDVTEVAAQLALLIDSKDPDDYYAWGVDLFSVCSGPETSICHDDIEGVALPDLPTVFLLNLITAIQDFKQTYQQVAILEDLLGRAFEQIKADPSRYMQRGGYYSTMADGIYITIHLTEDELRAEAGDFLDGLNTAF